MIWFSWGTDKYGEPYFRIYGIKVTMKRIGILIGLVIVVGIAGAITNAAKSTSGSKQTTTQSYGTTQYQQPYYGKTYTEADGTQWSCDNGNLYKSNGVWYCR
jgi:Tfp pilus assembly protein PilV